MIYTLSANTSHSGPQPTGEDGNPNYNQLGFAYASVLTPCDGVLVGCNDPGDIFDSRDNALFYRDGALPAQVLRRDTLSGTNTTTLVPMVQVTADSALLSPSAIAIAGGASFMYSGRPQGPVIGRVTGSTGAQSIVYSGIGSTLFGPSSNPPISVGTYLAVASVAGDSTHLPASSHPLNFNLCPVPLTITANDQSKIYGTVLDLGGPQTNFWATGLVNREVIRSVSMSASGGTQAGDTVGTYPLMPGLPVGSGFDPRNYAIQFLGGRLAVLPAPFVGLTRASVTVLGATNYDYSGNPVGPNTANPVGVTGTISFVYSGGGATPYASSPIRPVQPGDYQAVASVIVNTNFLGATSAPFNFSITMAPRILDIPLLDSWGVLVLGVGAGWMGTRALRKSKV